METVNLTCSFDFELILLKLFYLLPSLSDCSF